MVCFENRKNKQISRCIGNFKKTKSHLFTFDYSVLIINDYNIIILFIIHNIF